MIRLPQMFALTLKHPGLRLSVVAVALFVLLLGSSGCYSVRLHSTSEHSQSDSSVLPPGERVPFNGIPSNTRRDSGFQPSQTNQYQEEPRASLRRQAVRSSGPSSGGDGTRVNAQSREKVIERQTYFYLLGLVGERRLALHQLCPHGVLDLDERFTWKDVGVTVATLGLLAPKTVRIHCRVRG